MADSAEAMGQVVGYFAAAYQAKYDKALECLIEDRAELLAFYKILRPQTRFLVPLA